MLFFGFAKEIIKEIENNKLKKLSLYDDSVDDENAKALANALSGNRTITELSFDKIEISALGLRLIANALKNHPTLRELKLTALNVIRKSEGGNFISEQDEAIMAFAEMLKNNRVITWVDLSKNKLGKKSIKALAEMLQQNQAIEEINLSQNHAAIIGFPDYFCSGFDKEISIEEWYAKEEAEVLPLAEAFACAMKENRTLKVFTMTENGIDDEFTKVFSAGFANNISITSLDLSDNRISTDGVEALASAIMMHPSLRVLKLCDNQFGAEGVRFLATVIKKNTSIRALYLGGLNRFDLNDGELEILAKMLQENFTVTYLPFQETAKYTEHGLAIRGALERNSAIIKYNLALRPLSKARMPEFLDDVIQGLTTTLSSHDKPGHKILQNAEESLAFCNILKSLDEIGLLGLRQYKEFSLAYDLQKKFVTDVNYLGILGRTKENKKYLTVAESAFKNLSEITPEHFTYAFAQEAIQDLAEDLAAVRIPDESSESFNARAKLIWEIKLSMVHKEIAATGKPMLASKASVVTETNQNVSAPKARMEA